MATMGAAQAQSFLPGEFDPAIPTVTDTLGHAPGTRMSTSAEALNYLEALAKAAPDRMKIVNYGETWQGRPLNYVILSAPQNIARLDAIQSDLATIAAGETGNGSALPVTWLAYSVHGNEVSCTDAAMMMAYHLLAAKNDPRVAKMMEETLVIIDPVQNPDGRDRFIYNFRSNVGIEPRSDRQAAEHDEGWPSGRVNHYMFDMNRDWFALTQPETRAKVKAMLSWRPVVVADVHEMGGDSTYFFNPAAEPISPNITQSQRQGYEVIGRNNAAYFDQMGEPYFTREVFDLFYPGYGDTWNTHQGAIGMTFEQGSPRGLVFERSDGSLLTYAEATRNHFIASFSTADAVAQNADQFLSNYAEYRRANASGAAGSGAYVIDLAKRRWNAEALARRLVGQGINVVRREGPVSVCGRSYPRGYLAVPQAQGAARLVRALLDRNTELPREFIAEQEERRQEDLGHELYDVTAWSVGLMSGVNVDVCGSMPGGAPVSEDAPVPAITGGSGDFAVAVPWTDSGQARLVTLAIREGMVGRLTDEEFTSDGRTFPRGTVVFGAKANGDGALAKIEALSSQVGGETVRLASSWVEDGPNWGSGSFTTLTLPKVAIAWDEGVSQLSAGALRFILEQRFGLPVTPIRTNRFGRTDFADYDVILIPEGSPAGVMGSSGMSNLRSFVERGGVLVAVGRSLDAFTRGDNPMLSVTREAAIGSDLSDPEGENGGSLAKASEIEDEESYREAIEDENALPDSLPGALLNVVADTNSFLSAGYDDGGVVNADGSSVYTPLSRANGLNAVRFASADDLIASGYVWSENQRQMAFKPYLMAQPTGEGMTIAFAHDPSTRGYLDGLDLMIANAVLIAPSRVR
ncbi:M14 metallopeptidase family protein [Erythrobacter sp.]|uniref:M14 metallopeptidase family protein n=1 Tax=Erythrobacter sp. TaxID=1042 RepID=UPI002622AE07|nr:M14 metallopeptidase family protein [Erythrobacter sp.]